MPYTRLVPPLNKNSVESRIQLPPNNSTLDNSDWFLVSLRINFLLLSPSVTRKVCTCLVVARYWESTVISFLRHIARIRRKKSGLKQSVISRVILPVKLDLLLEVMETAISICCGQGSMASFVGFRGFNSVECFGQGSTVGTVGAVVSLAVQAVVVSLIVPAETAFRWLCWSTQLGRLCWSR